MAGAGGAMMALAREAGGRGDVCCLRSVLVVWRLQLLSGNLLQTINSPFIELLARLPEVVDISSTHR